MYKIFYDDFKNRAKKFAQNGSKKFGPGQDKKFVSKMEMNEKFIIIAVVSHDNCNTYS